MSACTIGGPRVVSRTRSSRTSETMPLIRTGRDADVKERLNTLVTSLEESYCGGPELDAADL